jgi:hypothetical protein
MTVMCQIVKSNQGYEGVILTPAGVTVYNTGFCGCAEDADGLMEAVILRNGWRVVPFGFPGMGGGAT